MEVIEKDLYYGMYVKKVNEMIAFSDTDYRLMYRVVVSVAYRLTHIVWFEMNKCILLESSYIKSARQYLFEFKTSI